MLQITKDPGIQLGPGRNRIRGREPISPRQAEIFKQEMDALGIPTTLSASDGNERVTYGEYKTQPRINIIGTNENFLLTNKYELEFGRNITPADIEFNRQTKQITDNEAANSLLDPAPRKGWEEFYRL